jgi:hypothetical protein
MCVFATMPMGALAKAKPNIVLFLCDDMDYTLGAWTPMKQTTQLFAEKVRLHDRPIDCMCACVAHASLPACLPARLRDSLSTCGCVCACIFTRGQRVASILTCVFHAIW